MTATYLQVTVAVFLAATVLGIIIHTVSTCRSNAALRRRVDALALFADCWPEREHDDDVTRCGSCSVLWTPTRVCGGAR